MHFSDVLVVYRINHILFWYIFYLPALMIFILLVLLNFLIVNVFELIILTVKTNCPVKFLTGLFFVLPVYSIAPLRESDAPYMKPLSPP